MHNKIRQEANMNILGVIPARWASTRFPGKPLAMIRGRSMIMRVYDKAVASGVFETVLVATEDERILTHVHEQGGKAIMTALTHRSGTDRCAEALQLLRKKTGKDWTAVINIQGDEPLVDPELMGVLAREFKPGGQGIITLAAPLLDEGEATDPNIVKVVCDIEGNALYFSRSLIPFLQQEAHAKRPAYPYLKHIGLYAYYSDTLLRIVQLPPSPLELAESLEQLRWLSNGYRVKVIQADVISAGVDVPEDLLKVEALLDD